MKEKLYSVGQVARILGFEGEAGTKRVRRLIIAGKLQGEDHGTGDQPRWYVTRSALRHYTDARRIRRRPNEYLN